MSSGNNQVASGLTGRCTAARQTLATRTCWPSCPAGSACLRWELLLTVTCAGRPGVGCCRIDPALLCLNSDGKFEHSLTRDAWPRRSRSCSSQWRWQRRCMPTGWRHLCAWASAPISLPYFCSCSDKVCHALLLIMNGKGDRAAAPRTPGQPTGSGANAPIACLRLPTTPPPYLGVARLPAAAQYVCLDCSLRDIKRLTLSVLMFSWSCDPFLWLAALAYKESADAAAIAIRHLCDACARHLAPHWQLVISLYDGVQASSRTRSGLRFSLTLC